MINIARPKGSNREWQENKRTIKAKFNIQKWANALTPKAMEVLEKTMTDPNASPTVRKGIAETVLNLVDKTYKDIGGNADYIKETTEQRDKRLREEQQQQAKKATEDNGGTAPLKPLINLKYEGTND